MTYKRDEFVFPIKSSFKFIGLYYLRVSHAAAKNADRTFLIATSRHRIIKSQLQKQKQKQKKNTKNTKHKTMKFTVKQCY